MTEKWDLKFKGKERMGHPKHIWALFPTYSVLLKRSRPDNSNHVLKDHQTWL
jgi:hypothetical protein